MQAIERGYLKEGAQRPPAQLSGLPLPLTITVLCTFIMPKSDMLLRSFRLSRLIGLPERNILFLEKREFGGMGGGGGGGEM
jgi:hypothetical protein